MKFLRIVLALFLFLPSLSFGGEPIKPVNEIPYFKTPSGWYGRPGWEERGQEFSRWLSPSVRLTYQGGGGGSGTICHYDEANNVAYVISAGHLFRRGRVSVQGYKQNPVSMYLEVFYHNEKKLDQPERYVAEVLFHVWENGVRDISVLKFTPKWKINWVGRIAPLDLKLETNRQYHSCGCDGLTEVAHYSVTFQQERMYGDISELVTIYNAPRAGRSGGGLFTDNHLLFGICSRGGWDYGYWTSLKQIHKYIKEEGLDFLLEDTNLANQIPIVDRNNPQGTYDRDYIPTPSK